MPKRFCVAGGLADWTRGGKRRGALSYSDTIDCGWGSSMYCTVKDILKNDVHRRIDLLPIDICKLIGNSDLVHNITNTRMSTGERNMQIGGNSLLDFRKICKKYSLAKLRRCNERNKFICLRVERLYFCNIEYTTPDSTQTEESKKIVWNRLKYYIEHMANLGSCPVVCAGSSKKNERRFKCKASYRYKDNEKKGFKGGYQLCPFNFTVKWDDSGYFILLLNNLWRDVNNGCAWWHNCGSKQNTTTV